MAISNGEVELVWSFLNSANGYILGHPFHFIVRKHEVFVSVVTRVGVQLVILVRPFGTFYARFGWTVVYFLHLDLPSYEDR